MKKSIWKWALSGLAAISFMACSEKNGDEPDPDTEYDDKMYLEETAQLFLSNFDAKDQRSLLQLGQYYSEELSWYDFPEEFYDYDRAKRQTNNLMSSIAKNDYMSISRTIYTYTLNMARFKGIYEPNHRYGEWVKTGSSDNFVLKFTDDYNNQCTVTVKGSADFWSQEVTDDYDYYDEYEYVIEIPKSLELTIVKANEELVKAKVESNFIENSSLSAKVEAKLMNIDINSEVKANNNQVKSTVTFSVDKNCLVSAEATADGYDLCNINAWKRAFQRHDDSDALATMISGMHGSSNIMDRIKVDAKVISIKNFVEYVGEWYDSYDYSNPEAEAKKAATKLSSAVSGDVFYAGSSKVRATLGWMAYQDYEGSYYEDWEVLPTITFTSDDSTYNFESYFNDKRFFKVVDLFEGIIDAYEPYFY